MLQNIEQKEIHPINGMIMLVVITIGLILSVGLIILGSILLEQNNSVLGGIILAIGIILVVIFPIMYGGLKIVGPNEALVLTLFGNYYGTILKPGYYYVNPFVSYNNPIFNKAYINRNKIENNDKTTVIPDITPKKTVSLKSITLNNGTQKVNDVLGNPIIIGAVVIWKVTLDNILEKLENAGIENVLALRGDIPKGSDLKQGDFKYASDLVSYIAGRGNFCIGVAGYPEKHPESPSFEKDIEMLKYKVDMGASFIITQLFFDNEYFYRFRERAEKAGINVPIVAGIMPIVNFSQIERFKVMCSSHIPENLIKSMEGKSEEDIASIGIDYAVKQCEDLVKNQVAGLHFYTLNRYMATKRILDNLHFLP